jgi:hypothetical protein
MPHLYGARSVQGIIAFIKAASRRTTPRLRGDGKPYEDNAMHDPKHQGETRDMRLAEFCSFNPDKPVLDLYEGQPLRVEGNKATLLTSPNARGTNPPVFMNKDRKEISCKIGVPTDVSKLVVGAHKSAAPKAPRGPSP